MGAKGDDYRGSPPRVREKHEETSLCRLKARITPACAGKTSGCQHAVSILWDHTRVCGKNVRYYRQILSVPGSPPRVREKLAHKDFFNTPAGITPACAGKTDDEEEETHTSEDHPRVCGKNSTMLWIYHLQAGSPPRVREKPASCLSIVNTLRITPACAGKTDPVTIDDVVE